jgi:hypothetical protein
MPTVETISDRVLINKLAQEIRKVDGGHSLSANALAEALMPFIKENVPQLLSEKEITFTDTIKYATILTSPPVDLLGDKIYDIRFVFRTIQERNYALEVLLNRNKTKSSSISDDR